MSRKFCSLITMFSSDKEALSKLEQTLSSNYHFIDKGCPLNALPITTSSTATTGATPVETSNYEKTVVDQYRVLKDSGRQILGMK